MLLMVEKAIRSRIDHAIHRYGEANNKYLKYFNKNNKSSNLNYWDVNNLSRWAILQNLPVSDFKCIKNASQFNEDFIRNYNEYSDIGYFLEVEFQYFENLRNLLNDLPTFVERMKVDKNEKFLASWHDKYKLAILIRTLKQSKITD